MADDQIIVMTVDCQHCGIKQRVHIAAITTGARTDHQTIRCLNCNKPFRVIAPARIVAGPFPE